MKYLRIPVEELQPIVKIFKEQDLDGLVIERLLAMVWSYRKKDDGMHYSNAKLGEMCDRSPSTIKRLMNAIKKEGLLESSRRFNSSTIHKPSSKFYALMKVKGHSDPSLAKEKGHHDPSHGSPRPPISFSKEKEDRTKKLECALRAHPNLERIYLQRKKAGYNVEKLNNEFETILNKKEKQTT